MTSLYLTFFFFFFSIELEPCKSEVDITIVDRICALLNPQPICVCNPVSNNKNTVSYQFLLYNYVLCIMSKYV